MVGSMKVQKKQRIERDDDKDEEDIRIKLLQHQIILLVSQKLCRESFILRNTLPNPTPIQELHIRWHKNCLPLHVDTWIHATFRHGVKEFDLSVNTHPNQPLELSRSSQAS